jgi:hypothetical protein
VDDPRILSCREVRSRSEPAREEIRAFLGTVRYLGIEVDDALSISEQVEL